MLDEHTIREKLLDFPLGGLKIFEQTGSTNDVALAWATEGAADMALVFAEEQTSGRGRGNRRWFSPPGTSLAFSLVLRPLPSEENFVHLFSGLGAMAVCKALEIHELHPQIKWPNDVLLNRRKVCGVLVEPVWMGDKVDAIVLGVGLNVEPAGVPGLDRLLYPATSIGGETGKKVDRIILLRDVLQAIMYWRSKLMTDSFSSAWDGLLAFRGEQVEVWAEGLPAQQGRLEGLGKDGSLHLRSRVGKGFTVQFGEVHLRPVL
jgi:BirA family biotin operon repressor/biotin-[acetyl-CoA-carboxylase] ligase